MIVSFPSSLRRNLLLLAECALFLTRMNCKIKLQHGSSFHLLSLHMSMESEQSIQRHLQEKTAIVLPVVLTECLLNFISVKAKQQNNAGSIQRTWDKGDVNTLSIAMSICVFCV